MADPIDTGEKTISGRTIWNDPETGKDYSERSTTFEIDGKYYTMPTVAKNGGQYTSDIIRDYVKENGPIDYITGEKLPEFRNREDAIEYAISRSSTRKQTDMAKGGVLMKDQMKMIQEGGIADDGMNRDPVSGNEVPSGSLASEVRDDIPAQLSEGEYVVPADVVRYFGVRVFEEMRMEAKMGLQQMEQDGRIGGEPIKGSNSKPTEITKEEIAQIENMISTGVAEGGLMDKIEFAAKNDNVINQRMNAGGMIVGFAPGGLTTSPTASYADPTKVDEVISKVMKVIQDKPELRNELESRGIQVNRTSASLKPEEINEKNPDPKIKGFAPGGVTAIPTEAQVTTPTSINNPFATLGGSYLQQAGATVKPYSPKSEFAQQRQVTLYSPEGVPVALELPDDQEQYNTLIAQGYTTSPPAQINNNSNNNDDFSQPEPPAYWNESGNVNTADFTSLETYGNSIFSKLDAYEKDGGVAGSMSGMPGAFGLLGALGKGVEKTNLIASANTTALLMLASGNTISEDYQAKLDKYTGSQNFIGKFLSNGHYQFNRTTEALGLEPSKFKAKDLLANKWTDEMKAEWQAANSAANQAKKALANIVDDKKSDLKRASIPKTTKQIQDSKSDAGLAQAKKIVEKQGASGPSAAEKQRARKNQDTISKKQKEKIVDSGQTYSGSSSEQIKKMKDKDTFNVGGRAEGGLMKRNKK